MLYTAIARDRTVYTAAEIGDILAQSDADLACEESCVEALIAHAVRPWQFNGSLLDARIEAHNRRTMRLLLQRQFPPQEE